MKTVYLSNEEYFNFKSLANQINLFFTAVFTDKGIKVSADKKKLNEWGFN